tara:strand:+ start:15059 stop:15250 length:192 start_codon:yes stop_codon:yes gene_type:complete
MKKIKANPWTSLMILLAILKIAGIIDIGWIWVFLPIWWWWPIAALFGIAIIGIIVIEEIYNDR